eukprot:972829-Prorocentrum_minimum.AAC.1
MKRNERGSRRGEVRTRVLRVTTVRSTDAADRTVEYAARRRRRRPHPPPRRPPPSRRKRTIKRLRRK